MKTALKEIMDSALVKAKSLLEAGSRTPCFFMCKGTHGTAGFDFDDIENEENERILGDRVYFNILGVNATEAVVALTRRVNCDLAHCSPEDLETMATLQGEEALVINGESGTERVNWTLPILRTGDGQFIEFGNPAEKTIAKEPGEDARYVAGIELQEWERDSALDQAGNLEFVAEMRKGKGLASCRGRSR
jgi:hypothetical protein